MIEITEIIYNLAIFLVLLGGSLYLLWSNRHIKTAFLQFISDFSGHTQAKEVLEASEIRYRRLFESAKDGILILDAETGMIVDVNPFLIRLLGYPREALMEKKVWELGFLKDFVANEKRFAVLQQKAYIRYEDMALETSDGQRIEVEFVSNVYLVNHRRVIQCNIRDISDRKRTEKALREGEASLLKLAHFDALTSLPNRNFFTEKANMAIAHAMRSGSKCAFLFIDLDHFKSVNDGFGHSVGDELLKDTGHKLALCIRETDTMARLGGDEFIVLLNDLDHGQGAQVFAERIREKFNVPRMIAGNDLFVTASIGIAVYPHDGHLLADLMKNADTAMYVAKESGRNRHSFFDTVTNKDAGALG